MVTVTIIAHCHLIVNYIFKFGDNNFPQIRPPPPRRLALAAAIRYNTDETRRGCLTQSEIGALPRCDGLPKGV
jgi:hypothetical protein